MADTNNIHLDAGEDYSETITYTDSGGSAVDMTGYTYELKVKEAWSGGADMFTLTGGSGIDTTNEASGVLVYTFTNTQTATLVRPVYQYQLKITSDTGVVTIILEGKIIPDPSI